MRARWKKSHLILRARAFPLLCFRVETRREDVHIEKLCRSTSAAPFGGSLDTENNIVAGDKL